MGKLFAPLFLFLFCTQLEAQINVVSNPEFDKGKTGWYLAKYNAADAVFMLSSSYRLGGAVSAKLMLSAPTSTKGDVKLFQDIEIRSNKVYEISFLAKADTTRSIDISIENDQQEYWKHNLQLTAHQQHFGPYSFASNTDDLLSYFSFHLGGPAGNVYLDSVMVIEKLPPAPEDLFADEMQFEFHQLSDHLLKIILPVPVVYYGNVKVSDLSGKRIVDQPINANDTETEVDVLNPGIYLLQVEIDKETAERKIVLH